jgi:hypothetical protein
MKCLNCGVNGLKRPKLFCSPRCESKWLKEDAEDVE